MDSVVKVSNLTKSFGKQVVLNNINLEFFEGDLIGMVGLNGCGKTTFFKCITGLIKFDGDISVFGISTKQKHKYFDKLIYIFDKDTYFSELSGYTTLLNYTQVYRNADKQEILKVMENVGLAGKEFVAVKKYSLGMKQRLNIAKIMLIKPKVVLMDEPFNGIDVNGVDDIIKLIIEYNKNCKTTFVVSSHQIGELEKFCKRLIIIKDQKIYLDKSLTNEAEIIIAVKLKNENDFTKLSSQFQFLHFINGMYYFKAINIEEEDAFHKFLTLNNIKYSHYSTENSIKNELMKMLREETK